MQKNTQNEKERIYALMNFKKLEHPIACFQTSHLKQDKRGIKLRKGEVERQRLNKKESQTTSQFLSQWLSSTPTPKKTEVKVRGHREESRSISARGARQPNSLTVISRTTVFMYLFIYFMGCTLNIDRF